jgi:uncharacterized membrane protein YhhN
MGFDRVHDGRTPPRTLIVAWFFVALTAVGLAATLIGEVRDLPLRLVAKPIASAGFLGLAVSLDATESSYGWWILIGLLFGFIGDMALLGSARSWFLAGLVAFLIGHLGYVIAFLVAGLSTGPTAAAAGAAIVAAIVIFRWLRPHLPSEMIGPVAAYVVIISAMVATAVGATAAGATGLILIGAVAFYLSDLAVARNRFVAPGSVNRIWGLPLYYLGQVLLAWSVA